MNLLAFYTEQGSLTELGRHASLADSLPTDVGELVRIIQGILIHDRWLGRYGVDVPRERLQELNLRFVESILDRALELDSRPWTEPRPPDKRVVVCCRDFSVVLCALLRHKGIPARARCGFATYFGPGHYEDHWICEHWSGVDDRWIATDAQLDGLQRRQLGVKFDTLDVAGEQFVSGGRAWAMCRRGESNPDNFGIGDAHGLWIVRGNMLRDLAALNKQEVVPHLVFRAVGLSWDDWPMVALPDGDLPARWLQLLDEIGETARLGDSAVQRLQSLFRQNDCLRPPDWMVRRMR
jgi:hypothetical protein